MSALLLRPQCRLQHTGVYRSLKPTLLLAPKELRIAASNWATSAKWAQTCKPHIQSQQPALRTHSSVDDAAATSSSQAKSSNDAPVIGPILRQIVLLTVALAGLLLLPAHLSGQLAGGRRWQAFASYAVYLLFFGSGTIMRTVKHGRLAPRKQDAQRSSTGTRAALLLFAAVAVPAGHYGAWWDNSLALAGLGVRTLAHQILPLLGYLTMLGAWALNTAAATALGKDFNRLVKPDRLVTNGCYAWVQHPLYTSYMMLFVGHCISLAAPAAAALLWASCLLYYSQRTQLEEQLLEESFGEEFRAYRRSTGRFLPRLGRMAVDGACFT